MEGRNIRLLQLAMVLSLTLSVLTIRCRENSNPFQPPTQAPPVDLRRIIPLAIGNSWTYRTVQCGIDCDSTMDTTSIIDTMWTNGQKQFKGDGRSPYITSTYFPGSEYYGRVDSSDYSIYICAGCLEGEMRDKQHNGALGWLPLHLLKTPLVKGNEWRCAEWDSTFSIHFGTVRILNPDTTIVLQSGTYYHSISLHQSYEQGGLGYDLYYDIAPGIGIIDVHFINPSIATLSAELIECHIR